MPSQRKQLRQQRSFSSSTKGSVAAEAPLAFGSPEVAHAETEAQRQLLQSAASRWGSRNGLEVPTQSFMKFLCAPQQVVPPPPVEAPKLPLQLGKQDLSEGSSASPLSTAAPSPSTTKSALRADAPSFSITKSALRADAPSFSATKSALRAEAPSFMPGVAAFEIPRAAPGAAAMEAQKPEHQEALPAVICIKKGSRGHAVVLLRDPDVVERGVQQSVAIIDGICMEVRRHHSKRTREEGEPEEMGLFVAWGHRVERKVTVSEEGLEAYFNALGKVPSPKGLEVVRPFEEGTLSFALRSSLGSMLPFNSKPEVVKAEKQQLLSDCTCNPTLVEQLFHAKGRLDDLSNLPPPPMARGVMMRVARAQLFPHSGEGGKEHDNRAGDKLAELAEAVGLMEDIPKGSAFLDLCGGPGAWSQFLLEHSSLELTGFGFTLKTLHADVGNGDWKAEDKDQWYPELERHPRWRALWGADGTGDLLKLGNLEHCAQRLSKEKVFICVADGGFSDSAIPANQLELYFYRLFLGEVLMAASCLREGGRFVCKLYTTFSPATAALLYAITRLFDCVQIVKPISSRVTGPERYLYASGFRASAKETKTIRTALMLAHKKGAGSSPLTTPLLAPVVAPEELVSDAAFLRSVRSMTEALCERQAKGLAAVVDRAEYLEEMALSVAERTGASTWPVEFKDKSDRRPSEESIDSHGTRSTEVYEPERYCRGAGKFSERRGGFADRKRDQDGGRVEKGHRRFYGSKSHDAQNAHSVLRDSEYWPLRGEVRER